MNPSSRYRYLKNVCFFVEWITSLQDQTFPGLFLFLSSSLSHQFMNHPRTWQHFSRLQVTSYEMFSFPLISSCRDRIFFPTTSYSWIENSVQENEKEPYWTTLLVFSLTEQQEYNSTEKECVGKSKFLVILDALLMSHW